MSIAISILEYILFIPSMLMVLYLFIFAVLSKKKIGKQLHSSFSHKKNRIVVLIPAYNEDGVVIDTLKSALCQSYDPHLFDVYVISDHMKPETDAEIIRLGGKVIRVEFENSSKAKALNYTLDQLKDENYDILVILDADNLVVPHFVSTINAYYNKGWRAIQAHRIAKNTDTEIALLDAISEEINNSIFRRGHVVARLSSALIGSGMAFDFTWFKQNVSTMVSVGEDKDLELTLALQNIRVYYLDQLHVYDEKTRKENGLYHQRRRWIASQIGTLRSALPYFFGQLAKGNLNYLDRVYQWTMLPRIMLLGLVIFMSLFTSLFFPAYALKWVILFVFLAIALYLAIPSHLLNKRLGKALLKLPKLFFVISTSFFRTKGAYKQFIHTDRS
ncbi:MAG: glycosyltransferase [Bacteroidales bacterium]